MEFRYAFTEWSLRFPSLDVKVRSGMPMRPVLPPPAGVKVQLPIGATVWSSALALCAALASERTLVDGKRVLELGSGSGLGATVAAKLGGLVTASDVHPDMAELVAFNAALNGVAVSYASYAWDSEAVPGRFDVVIGSDVLYEPAQCGTVLTALSRTLVPGGMAVIADPGRRYLDMFESLAAERGFGCDHQLRSLDDVTEPGGIRSARLHPGANGPFHIFKLQSRA